MFEEGASFLKGAGPSTFPHTHRAKVRLLNANAFPASRQGLVIIAHRLIGGCMAQSYEVPSGTAEYGFSVVPDGTFFVSRLPAD